MPTSTSDENTTRTDNKFRVERLEPKIVFHDLDILTEADGIPVDLKNISTTGARLRARTIKTDEAEPISITIKGNDGVVLVENTATIRWSEFDSMATDCGIKFDKIVDLVEVRKKSEDLKAKSIMEVDFNKYLNDLPQDYILLSNELLHHLATLKIKANAFEAKFKKSSDIEKQELANYLIQECGPEFQDIWYRFNDLTLTIDRRNPTFAAMKWHTENVIRPHFMNAPVWKRSWDKPFGYAGDFIIMLFAYDSHQYVEAPSLYDATIHGYLAHTLGECIRGRMSITIDAIQQRLREAESSKSNPVNILNLGCGAARELPILFENKNDFAGKSVQFDLLDIDDRALQSALNLALPIAAECSPDIKIDALNVSLFDMVKTKNVDQGPMYDVVYSLGLIDYLPFKMAKRVAAHFYGRLKAGGIITWCNVSTNRETCYWPLEFITDWTLHYRDKETMMEIFDFPGAQITLDIENSKQIWVITARKPL